MINRDLLNIFLDVIKLDALSGYEKTVADYIRSSLAPYNLEINEDESNKFSGSDTGNLICEINGGGDFVILSHMDTARSTKAVVPVLNEDRITSSGDTVLGVDNRVGIAVILYTIKRIFSEGIKTKPFTVAFTTCEETTLLGSKNLGLNKNIKKGFVFDSSLRPGNFIYSACGSMCFKAEIIGKASHSGLAPEMGINSIEIAGKAISKIKQGKYNKDTTVNIGIINGGTAVNVVPEKTTLEGEVRSFNRNTVEAVINEINDTFKNEAEQLGGHVNFTAEWDFEPYKIPFNSDVYKEISATIIKCGLDPIPVLSLGGSDANSLNANGITSVNIGIGAQNPHSNDEFILFEDLQKSAEIAMSLITQ